MQETIFAQFNLTSDNRKTTQTRALKERRPLPRPNCGKMPYLARLNEHGLLTELL